MATDRQIAANRRNGSLGRGPRTSAGKARSSRNALKHGLSIPVSRDKTLRRANCGAGPNIGAIGSRECIWASAGRGRSGARARSRSRRIGGGSYARRDYCRVEWWTGTRHCADSRPSQVAEARTLRASGILQTKASATGSLNQHGLREKQMCDCLKLNWVRSAISKMNYFG